MAAMVTACYNLIKIGGGGGCVAHKYHDICFSFFGLTDDEIGY